jgi:hypothetical protein
MMPGKKIGAVRQRPFASCPLLNADIRPLVVVDDEQRAVFRLNTVWIRRLSFCGTSVISGVIQILTNSATRLFRRPRNAVVRAESRAWRSPDARELTCLVPAA